MDIKLISLDCQSQILRKAVPPRHKIVKIDRVEADLIASSILRPA